MTFMPTWSPEEGRCKLGDLDADIWAMHQCSWWLSEYGCPFCTEEYVQMVEHLRKP